MAKKQSFTTPVTECRYPFLDKPDTKFNKDGVYRIELLFDPDDGFIKKLDTASKKAFDEAKKNMKPKDAKTLTFHPPYQSILDDEGEDTGMVGVKFKTYAQFTDKEGNVTIKKVPIYDAQGKPIKVCPRIGNGSKVSVAFTVNSKVVTGKFFYVLYLNAVQLVDLVEFEPDGSKFGFEKHTDGFEAESFDAPDSHNVSADNDDDNEPF